MDGSTTEFRVPDLIEKNDYLFRVMAVNKAGQSEPLDMEKSVTAKSPFGKGHYLSSLCKLCYKMLCDQHSLFSYVR